MLSHSNRMYLALPIEFVCGNSRLSLSLVGLWRMWNAQRHNMRHDLSKKQRRPHCLRYITIQFELNHGMAKKKGHKEYITVNEIDYMHFVCGWPLHIAFAAESVFCSACSSRCARFDRIKLFGITRR